MTDGIHLLGRPATFNSCQLAWLLEKLAYVCVFCVSCEFLCACVCISMCVMYKKVLIVFVYCIKVNCNIQ